MKSSPAKNLPEEIASKFDVIEWKHASAILYYDFPDELKEILKILGSFTFTTLQICNPGGGLSEIAKNIHSSFANMGWQEKKFRITVSVDDEIRINDTHKIDHYKSGVAVETEWNSKDSVYDRDLKSFRQLHDLGIISVGIIITRADSLQDLFDRIHKEVGDKYGPSTTHMSKLLEEVNAGTAGNCPLLIFGITNSSYVENLRSDEVIALLAKIKEEKKKKKDDSTTP
jgi:hypothetical protein